MYINYKNTNDKQPIKTCIKRCLPRLFTEINHLVYQQRTSTQSSYRFFRVPNVYTRNVNPRPHVHITLNTNIALNIIITLIRHKALDMTLGMEKWGDLLSNMVQFFEPTRRPASHDWTIFSWIPKRAPIRWVLPLELSNRLIRTRIEEIPLKMQYDWILRCRFLPDYSRPFSLFLLVDPRMNSYTPRLVPYRVTCRSDMKCV